MTPQLHAAPTSEQIAEAIRKAQAIQELVKSDGWKYIMELVDTFISKEAEALAGKKLGENYYKTIGFLQSLVYFSAIPGIMENEDVRDYLMHAGRLIGFRWAQKAPKHFFDAAYAAKQYMNQAENAKSTDLQLEEKRKYFEKQKSV